MFFIMGIYNRSKELNCITDMSVCPDCGRYCSYKIFVDYICLSLFFIPVIKWGKHYYAVSSCCGKRHELNREMGKKAERGEKINF